MSEVAATTTPVVVKKDEKNTVKNQLIEYAVAFKYTIAVLYAAKLLRIAITYISLNMATNLMSQVYIEKVLVNNENPQPLEYFIAIAFLIEALLGIVVIILATLVQKWKNDIIPSDIWMKLLTDHVFHIIFVGYIGYSIAGVMQNKKYFLYKDDGLRGIRAISSIMFKIGTAVHLVPFGLMCEVLVKYVGNILIDAGSENKKIDEAAKKKTEEEEAAAKKKEEEEKRLADEEAEKKKKVEADKKAADAAAKAKADKEAADAAKANK
jgi:hypothetical protein